MILINIELNGCVLTPNVAGQSEADPSSSFTGVQLHAPLGGPPRLPHLLFQGGTPISSAQNRGSFNSAS